MFVAPTRIIDNDKNLADFLTEHILDENLDPTQIAILLSNAKNQIELLEKPYILESEDSSQTRSSGDTFLSMKSLPDDYRVHRGLFVQNRPYRECQFAARRKYKDSPYRFYIDHKNKQFAICGTGGANETINLPYIVGTDDFTAASVVSTEIETLTWPKELWALCAWHAAVMISTGTDVGADDLSFRMSEGQNKQYENMLAMFRNWDQDLKLASIENRAGYAEDEYPDDEDGGFGIGHVHHLGLM